MIFYDVKVFKHDWIVVFKKYEEEQFWIFQNNSFGVETFIEQMNPLLVGFNNKHYGNYIIKAILSGADNATLKDINDFIIGGKMGFEHLFVKDNYGNRFNSFDTKDDMRKGLSLKEIEGHLYVNIEETSVPFNLDRPLTPEEVKNTIDCCKHDAIAIERLYEVRKDYFTTKARLAEIYHIDPYSAIYSTNAKLTALVLDANNENITDDERDYVIPEGLNLDRVPVEVIEFFNQIHDESISDDDLFAMTKTVVKQNIDINYAWGGVHGAIKNYIDKSDDEYVIKMFDVRSLYPSLEIFYNYYSRAMNNPLTFKDMYDTRLIAKAEENFDVSDPLKLILNTAFGAMLNKYNPLYDPKMARSICISGQLFLTDLLMGYLEVIPDLVIGNFNTDGILIKVKKSDLTKIYKVNKEWEERTKFRLEEDTIVRIIQKDVNNYIMEMDSGKVKTKGGFVTFGESKGGSWSINNSGIIIKEAIIEYLLHGTPPEHTIESCDDVKKFQFIAKAGGKYSHVYQEVDGEQIPTQKVNRVFASKDKKFGTLFKVKTSTKKPAKIDTIPSNCRISNNMQISIDEIDKQWYTNSAIERITKYVGGKRNMPETKKKPIEKKATKSPVKQAVKPKVKGEEKQKVEKQVDYSKMSLARKLNTARVMFLEQNPKKSGKNTHQQFMYFELGDIVPVKNAIYEILGLLDIIEFTENTATLTLIDIDSDKEMKFNVPFIVATPIIGKTGNPINTDVQSMGSSITYYRRYLYQIVLDIVENDELDPTVGKNAFAKNTNTIPTTPEKRNELKQSVAKSDPDNVLTIKLDEALVILKREKPGKYDDFINEVNQTKHTYNKKQIEELIVSIGSIIGG